jgi:hypothetical protein
MSCDCVAAMAVKFPVLPTISGVEVVHVVPFQREETSEPDEVR